MNNYNITEKDIPYIEAFKDAFLRGLYVQGGTVTEVYNRVFNRNLNPTNCQTCVKTRVKELLKAYEDYQAKQNEVEEKEVVEESITIEVKPKLGRKPRKSEE